VVPVIESATLISEVNKIKRFFRSIRFRLTLWSLAIVTLVLVAFSVFIFTSQAQAIQASDIASLELSTRVLLSGSRSNALVFDDGESHGPSIKQITPIRDDSEVQALVTTNGDVVASLGPAVEADFQVLMNSWEKNLQQSRFIQYNLTLPDVDAKPQTVDYLFMLSALRLTSNGQNVILVVGRPMDPSQQLPRLAVTLLIGSMSVFMFTLLGGYWLAGRVMRPVKIITRAAQEISETDLRRRLNLNSPDELGELADTFDAMLARLQSAFDRQRQFTADASHELRTPLSIIKLESERALEHHRSTEEYAQALSIIQSESDFMAGLVNNLLTLARLDSGQAFLNPEPLDLSELSLEVVERLEPLASRKCVTLSTGDLPELHILGDHQFLAQMLSNLIENAIKYADGNDPQVRVETGRDAKTSSQEFAGESATSDKVPNVWVRVIDNGPGISSEHLPFLFDRFYRVDKSRTRLPDEIDINPGSGIGLSIVQWIVQAHKGTITVESEVGCGTTFTVLLPMKS
jgi:two-component system OmpR family sensor kinase